MSIPLQRSLATRLALLAGALLPMTAARPRPAAAQQRYTLSGSDVAIWDLVGRVALDPGTGAQVVVTVAPSGPDASRLQVRHGELDGHDALRVVFPVQDVRYDARRDYGGDVQIDTRLRLRDDGTFGRSDGEPIRISTRGGDTEARADCRVAVPQGATVTVHVAAGVVTASNVAGQITADVLAADVRGEQLRGPMRVHSTSGDVSVDGARGPVAVETASGDVTLSDVQDDMMIRTASGDIRLHDVHATRATVQSSSGDLHATSLTLDELAASTSSGDVTLRDARVSDLTVSASSGDLDVTLAPGVRSARLAASSGDVTLRVPLTVGIALDASTGSGDIDVDDSAPAMQVLERRDHRFLARIGDGSGRVETSTASGDVRVVSANGGE